MPNPSFQPLTLSVEQWLDLSSRSYVELVRECEAQAQEAASLRQRLEMKTAEVDMLRGVGCMEDGDGPCGACLKCRKSQLEQAQKERDSLRSQLQDVQSDYGTLENEKSQAEAVLEEMREFLEINYAGLHEAAQVFRDVCLNVLERRRSTPGQEKA